MRRASLPGLVLAASVCVGLMYGQTYAQTTKPEPRYQISGTLVSSADGSAIAHGHLVPTLVMRGRAGGRRFPAAEEEFDSDERGHFVITLPSAGMWNLMATARGYARKTFQEHEQFSTGVVLTAAAPAMDIRFVLDPEAEITGVVLDEAGEPVRNAQASLVTVHPPEPDRSQRVATTRTATQTDDRGEYEFPGLPAGSYRICVRARPWYAEVRTISGNGPSPDPSLDFTYAPTWFPGGDDPDAAETLTLKAGDSRQADFHLVPVPSIHLLIDLPASSATSPSGRGAPMNPMVQRIDSSEGFPSLIGISYRSTAQGQLDVGGLSPGLYQVRVGGQEGLANVVRVTAGSAQTLDLNAASNEARVTVRMDGLPGSEAGSVQVNLLDPESGRSVLVPNFGEASRGGPGRGGGEGEDERDRVLEVPPGRYEVVLRGRPDLYLTGISAKGAEATGRMVTVPAGESSLTVHVGDGRGTLSGVASFKGKPSVGAMVLLVPTTLGEPGAIAILRRDQSNTDGSFDVPEVIPGQYILIAIDNGWEINWSDAATLQQYLTQGVPVDLRTGGDMKQNIAAQAP